MTRVCLPFRIKKKIMDETITNTNVRMWNTTESASENLTLESNVDDEDSFMEKAATLMAYQVATYITKYWFPILVPIGLVGNMLSFLVMIKPHNRKMSTCIYMAVISVNDNLMMFLSLHTWLVTVLKVHKRFSSECKLKSTLSMLALQNSTFQVLAMSLDKYIAIKWPHRSLSYTTPKRAKIITSAIFLSVSIYNVPNIFLTRLIQNRCFSYSVDIAFTQVFSWLTFVLNAIIPFSLLIYMNCIIVKTVRHGRKMFGGDTANQSGDKMGTRNPNLGIETRQNTMKNAENQLTIMLLLVTTLFLVLLCPTYIRFIYLLLVERDTPSKYASGMLLYELSYKLYITNSAINFFLYCISGKRFRQDVKDILCCNTNTWKPWAIKENSIQSNVTRGSNVS